jgi:hypothetical protein
LASAYWSAAAIAPTGAGRETDLAADVRKLCTATSYVLAGDENDPELN